MGLGGRVRPAAANQNEGNNAGDEQPAANEDEQEEDGGEGVEGANNGNNGAQGGEILWYTTVHEVWGTTCGNT